MYKIHKLNKNWLYNNNNCNNKWHFKINTNIKLEADLLKRCFGSIWILSMCSMLDLMNSANLWNQSLKTKVIKAYIINVQMISIYLSLMKPGIITKEDFAKLMDVGRNLSKIRKQTLVKKSFQDAPIFCMNSRRNSRH